MGKTRGSVATRVIVALGISTVGIVSASPALADNWAVLGGTTAAPSGQILSPGATRVGIGGVGATAAQLDVQANTGSREGLVVNQVQGSPAIARFRQNGTTRMLLTAPGNLGIGTTSPSEKLHVEGNVHVTGFLNANGGLRIKTAWTMEVPDYVFEPAYKPMALADVEKYVRTNKHLPEVPSAAEMNKNGMDVAQLNLLLLKKVEELTLHVIEQDKELKRLVAARAK
jgi:hypothetical protein